MSAQAAAGIHVWAGTPVAPAQGLEEEGVGLQPKPSPGMVWDGRKPDPMLSREILLSPRGVPGSGKVPYFFMVSKEETVKGEMWPAGS